jgi:signal transduction histidine kinase
MLIDLAFFGGAFVAGLAVRRHQRRVEHVAEAAAGRTEDAVRDERRRIAGELHDVIAHGMSTMVVQADAARQGLGDDQRDTREALGAIEETGRDALREMRRLLGLLREEDNGAALLTPQPGIADLHTLVRSVQRAGLPVDLRIDGDPVPLSPGTDLAAYRIVQEALTNTLRHAGPARATVRVSYTTRDLVVDVSDTGRGGTGNGDGAGKGLITTSR